MPQTGTFTKILPGLRLGHFSQFLLEKPNIASGMGIINLLRVTIYCL